MVDMIITPFIHAVKRIRNINMKLTGNGAQPTVKDVAALAGVSRATASRALSDYGAVHAETRDRVLAAAAQLGYVPNVIARSMRATRPAATRA